MSISLSQEQSSILDAVLLSSEKVQTLGGYAGTGKTTLIKAISERVDIEVATPTWKAALVLRGKGFPDAITIHSLMLKPTKDDEGNLKFEEDRDKALRMARADKNKLLVIDESSMVTQYQYDLICQNWAGKILFVGDHGQLPPVGGDFNIMENPMHKLEKIHRQAEGNPIIDLATRVRGGNFPTSGQNGWAKNGEGWAVMDSSELWYEAESDNFKDFQFITFSNNQRVAINKACRRSLGHGGVFKSGDRIIGLENQIYQRVYNGMIFDVLGASATQEDKMIIDVNDGLENRSIYVHPQSLGKSKGIMSRDLLEAKGGTYRDYGASVDYSYAITCHKSQGSSFDSVGIILDNWSKSFLLKNGQLSKWVYTAVTRAEKKVFLDI